MSRPAWARGLKLNGGVLGLTGITSRPAWARGLKPINALFVLCLSASRPAWARGLKHLPTSFENPKNYVAPRVGAWIETMRQLPGMRRNTGRAPRGRVD